MGVTIKKIELWHAVVDNKPGALAGALRPLADAGVDLEIVMATDIPGGGDKASIGVFPIKGRKAASAARTAGFEPAAAMPSLLVGGDNRAGLGEQMSEAIAASGVNIGVAFAQVMGGHFSAVFGFASADDAAKASAALRKIARAATPKPAPAKAATKGAAKPTRKAPARPPAKQRKR
ncbi:MAG TPA: hypothetical protein VF816_04940 [Rhodocyclaceae bacterium]